MNSTGNVINGGDPHRERVTVIESKAVQYLLMKLRNKQTKGKVREPAFCTSARFAKLSAKSIFFRSQEFMIYADRLMRLLAEEALCRLPTVEQGSTETPCGIAHGPIEKEKVKICLVSVVRAGIFTWCEAFSTRPTYTG
jgi:uracil phosphoribosyltransferase